MAQWLAIDPTTRDYVFVNGSPVESDRILEAAYYAIQIPRNNWTYASANQGSYMYMLQNQKRTASIEQQFSAYATQAINEQLIANNLATAVSVENTSATSTATANNINITPSAVNVGNQLDFNSV